MTEKTDLESQVELQHLNNGKITGSSLREDSNVTEGEPRCLDILDRVKITNTFESPIATIRGFLMDEKDKDLSFDKDELKKVEERLKIVFSEYYKKLQLLKNYRWKSFLSVVFH